MENTLRPRALSASRIPMTSLSSNKAPAVSSGTGLVDLSSELDTFNQVI